MHVEGVLRLKMNGPAIVLFLAQKKKAQERKLISKRKGMQEGDFRHMYAADASFHSCFCCCLLATFSPSFPCEKYGRNYLNLHLE